MKHKNPFTTASITITARVRQAAIFLQTSGVPARAAIGFAMIARNTTRKDDSLASEPIIGRQVQETIGGAAFFN
jgi:hypothetical protein